MKYNRSSIESIKNIKKKRPSGGDPNLDELVKFEMFESRNLGLIGEKNSNQIILYGQNFDDFKAKINNFDEKFSQKNFNITNDENIAHSVKVLEIFLDNSIKMENYLATEDEIISFVDKIN